MNSYIIDSTENKLQDFEQKKQLILNKINTNYTKEIIIELIESLNNMNLLNNLSEEFPNHFKSSSISWLMEYEIAKKVLLKELESVNFSYTFELTNYLFYYLMLPEKLRSSFFLIRGLPVSNSFTKEILGKLQSYKQYVIYKQNQELYSTYILKDDKKLFDFCESLINPYSIYKDKLTQNLKHDKKIMIIQINEN